MDEIGDMSPAMQARLLRVLQEGEIRRVGGERSIHVDVRVLAATHRNLSQEVEASRFREDLLYRLQVLTLDLPPLRDRQGDIALLADHILARIAAERGRKTPKLDGEVLNLLERYSWPGNIRELENALQRLAVLAGRGPITPATVESDPGLRRSLLRRTDGEMEPLSLEYGEKSQIRRALQTAGGNRNRAAHLLGISRATLYRKLKQHDLQGIKS
jgi:two-component system response regulator HydG